MEIADYCKLILYSDRLEDKIFDPGPLVDKNPGSGVEPPDAPGRPDALRFPDERRKKLKSPGFPGPKALERGQERGRALHFFANHELLALELMALALLRFPNAPPNFRRRTVTTMREEQKHMRMYVRRMEALGVGFGEIPVSPFFWRCLARVDSLEGYVAGMALTFEQANLDFALHFQKAFRQVGDLETSELMREVYEDEIGHVRHGLACMRQWKSPELDDFEAHRSLLRPPLTASRAKGIGFSHEARRRAGFDNDYIARLESFTASKGRAPAVYWFNPSCEFEIAHGDRYNPPKVAERLELDLEALPMYLCANDDVVMVRDLPRPEFLATLRARAGFKVPEFALRQEHRRQIRAKALWHPQIARVAPWGWSPAALRRSQALRGRVHRPSSALHPESWTEGRARLHRKSTAQLWLREMLDTDWAQALGGRLCAHSLAGRVCTSLDEVRRAMAEQLSLTRAGELAIKAPLGTSGKNIVRVYGGRFDIGQEGWVQNVLDLQGEIVVEPWLDKRVDLSSRAYVHEDGRVEWRGRARFYTDQRGQYLAGAIGPVHHTLDRSLLRFAHHDGREQGWLEAAMRATAEFVGAKLYEGGYAGPVGIDALIYRRAGEEGFAFKPIVEVNPRYTMGHVLRGIQARILGGRPGLWTLVRTEDLRASGFEDVAAFVRHCDGCASLSARSSQGQVERGAWFTTDPLRAQQVLSMAIVGTNDADLRQLLVDIGDPIRDLATLSS